MLSVSVTLKAFRVTEADNIEWKIKNFYNDTDMFLFDTEGVGYGGTGHKFNWDKLKGLNIDKPFFIGGGISPLDPPLLLEFARDPVAKDLFAVDINSKFEISPGIKDMAKVKQFVKDLNG